MFNSSHFHPMSVHFPIVLIIVGFIFYVFAMVFNKKETCLFKTAFILMILGTFAAITCYFTGEFFTEEFNGEAGDIKELHEVFAKISMFIMMIVSCLQIFVLVKGYKQPLWKWIVFALFFMAFISIIITGLLGGHLVYFYMIGL